MTPCDVCGGDGWDDAGECDCGACEGSGEKPGPTLEEQIRTLREDFEMLAEAMYGLDWRKRAKEYRAAVVERQQRIERGDPCQLTHWTLHYDGKDIKVAVCGLKEGHDGECLQTLLPNYYEKKGRIYERDRD